MHREPRTGNRTLEFQKVGPFLIHVRSFCFENFIETLALQTATGDGEVDEGHPGAEIRGELDLPRGATGRSVSSHPRPYPLLPRLRGGGPWALRWGLEWTGR